MLHDDPHIADQTNPSTVHEQPRQTAFDPQLNLLDQPWQALLDSTAEGIWGVDLAGRCTFVNRAAQRMLGFNTDELVGRNMHAMVHHHREDGSIYPAEECSMYDVFRHNRPFANQVDHVFRKDGSRFYAEMSAQPILHEGKVLGAVVTFRDITQSRQAEEALRRSEKLAAVGQLASSIAHEINNPLESVTNLLYLVRTSQSLTDVHTYTELAEAELARVADIATQTLRFHRQKTEATLVDLAQTLPALLRLYASRLLNAQDHRAPTHPPVAMRHLARRRHPPGAQQSHPQRLRRYAPRR